MLSGKHKQFMQVAVAADRVDYMFESDHMLVAQHSRAGHHFVLVRMPGLDDHGYDWNESEDADMCVSKYVDAYTGMSDESQAAMPTFSGPARFARS